MYHLIRHSRLHQCDHGGGNGLGLPRTISTKVRIIPDGGLHETEVSILFQFAIHAPCRGEPHGCVDEYA